jgi:hypothetical protein
MDFQQLLAKMQELDTTPAPVAEVQPVQSEQCGMMPPPSMSMNKPDTPPPSLSVNLNAHGLDDIEAIMKLVSKVNPDMEKPSMPPLPSLSAPPSIMSIKPSMPPLKMLPDFDADNDDKIGGEMDLDKGPDSDRDDDTKNIIMKMADEKDDEGDQPGGMISSLDRDGDGDHDMDDHDLEKDDAADDSEEKKKEEWANEPDVNVKSIDYMNNKLAGGMNRPKDTFPKVSDGDNPMKPVRENDTLRSQIRAELMRRLSEAKGAK